ncbi:response regulator [Verrucomicrobiota bacterium]
MLKILFVEDEPAHVQPVINSLDRDGGFETVVKDFRNAKSTIKKMAPDIIILDLLAGDAADPNIPGLKTYDWIWQERFCPLVIYSARPEAFTDERDSHPFVRVVQKGSKSVQQIKKAISGLQPHIEAVADTESYVRKELAFALRYVAPYAFEVFPSPSAADKRKQVIVQAGRRRLAALMDDLSRHGTVLASWEQYLCPPVSKHVCLGDVLRKAKGTKDDPTAFRVVLTPTCDMVKSDKRKAKVDNVLLARCCSVTTGVASTSLKNIGAKKLKDKLTSPILTQGYFENAVPFPELSGRIPHMMANLHDVELVPLKNIGEGRRLERVASVDSPFRELIAWAYIQLACRPGLPDRDINAWSNGIVDAYTAEKDK